MSGSIIFPAGITTATFKGIGGGGGGGGGAGSNAAGGQGGGGGGGGGAANMSDVTVPVTAGIQYDIVIGAAGTGGGGGGPSAPGNFGLFGGDTIVTVDTTGQILIAFRGAAGGNRGLFNSALQAYGGSDEAGPAPLGFNFDPNLFSQSPSSTAGTNPLPLPRSGGNGGSFGAALNQAVSGGIDQRTDTTITPSTTYFVGGTFGATAGAPNGSGGGGGGASALGNGGNGGNGTAAAGTPGQPPTAPNNTGAGGGGGGGGGSGGNGGAGANGATGYLEVTF